MHQNAELPSVRNKYSQTELRSGQNIKYHTLMMGNSHTKVQENLQNRHTFPHKLAEDAFPRADELFISLHYITR